MSGGGALGTPSPMPGPRHRCYQGTKSRDSHLLCPPAQPGAGGGGEAVLTCPLHAPAASEHSIGGWPFPECTRTQVSHYSRRTLRANPAWWAGRPNVVARTLGSNLVVRSGPNLSAEALTPAARNARLYVQQRVPADSTQAPLGWRWGELFAPRPAVLVPGSSPGPTAPSA